MKSKVMKLNNLAEKFSFKQTQITLETIIANLPGHVYWKDKKGVYIGCNQSQALSIGLKNSKDIIGKTDFDISLNKEKAKKFRENDLAVMKSCKMKSFEEKTVVNGIETYVLSQKVPLLNDKGQPFGIIGISLDISERKNLEIKLLDEIKKTNNLSLKNNLFFSIASHEITNRISNIILLLTALKKDLSLAYSLKKSIFDLIADAISETENAISSINYLKKILSDEIELSFKNEKCNIEEFIKNIVSIYKQNNIKNATFNLNIHAEVPKLIEFPSLCIREILNILINNSVKHIEKNGLVNITVNIEKKRLRFSIKDNGIGISQKQLQKLFLPVIFTDFYIKNYKFSNSSIKLSYVKKILENINGEFEIISNENEGTEVNIYIDYLHLHLDEQINLNYKNFKVLMIEDNEVTLYAQKNILEELITEIHVAKNGIEAIKMAANNSYDIIFTDISLPDINGIEVMNIINKMENNKNAFFVAITSHTSEKDYEIFMEENFSDVLYKPINVEDFEQILNNLKNMKKLIISMTKILLLAL